MRLRAHSCGWRARRATCPDRCAASTQPTAYATKRVRGGLPPSSSARSSLALPPRVASNRGVVRTRIKVSILPLALVDAGDPASRTVSCFPGQPRTGPRFFRRREPASPARAVDAAERGSSSAYRREHDEGDERPRRAMAFSTGDFRAINRGAPAGRCAARAGGSHFF